MTDKWVSWCGKKDELLRRYAPGNNRERDSHNDRYKIAITITLTLLILMKIELRNGGGKEMIIICPPYISTLFYFCVLKMCHYKYNCSDKISKIIKKLGN